ncbi:MAG: efflux RND transporter permease subunit [Halofilum sp. (in: g-proteobacteria)]|nr:efflux RND transporter permease subunit [Halofilum sp. (in: g-proteobacteria)]
MTRERLGLSGALARKFLESEITPLLALVGLLLGLFAVAVTPREEEPQIDVTFANVFIPYPGASAQEVESLVTAGAERMLSEIEGVEHIYSVSSPGMSTLTVQFTVGEPRTEAIVRLYNAVYENQDWLPPNVGVGTPLIKPRGIDDVPIVAGTLWTDDPGRGAHELARVARAIETELKRVPGTRDIYTLGAPERVVHVQLDPARLAGYDISIADLRDALGATNASVDAGTIVRGNEAIQVRAGTFLTTPAEVADLVVGMNDRSPVFLADVAEVRQGPDRPEQQVRFGRGSGHPDQAGAATGVRHPAVTIAVAKKPGENAVDVARAVIDRFEQLRGTFVPEGVHATVTRDYGKTAHDKSQTLIQKLIFATASVVVLVLLALGWREAFIVGAAVVLTLTITLFASWAWGFTLNRVSLFALIFSIGILVDDAIVVVENIHRHMHIGDRPLAEAIPLAVDEVGGPTILATFTVIAALLPMAFVSGLMGPYMSPIPINASTGMLISLLVAFVFTPWLFLRVYRRRAGRGGGQGSGEQEDRVYRFLYAAFQRYLRPFLNGRQGRPWRLAMLAVVLVLIAGSLSLAGFRLVVLKMLPFDNKSEFQVVVDLPEGTPLEQTQRVLDALADHLTAVPEVTDIQTYAGTSAPINFNGLVRQYYLRREAHMGDIQVNLVDKDARERQSHDIARAVRDPLQRIGARFDANVKIVEVPPGPPVLAPLVAEIYGPEHGGRREVARQVAEVFRATGDVVDVDTTLEAPQARLLLEVDRQRAARLGVSQRAVADAVHAAVRGEDASYLHDDHARQPIPVRLELAEGAKSDPDTLAAVRVRSRGGQLVPLGEVVSFERTTREEAIHHKDLLPVVYVTGDVAGTIDSPLYGMGAIAAALAATPLMEGEPLAQHWIDPPANPYRWSLKWDGEWQITYETFRDMGIAYSVGLILIYLLVVAQFRSYAVPLIIMAPIPLTLIGILPGHALLDRQFTATSMIGMIALAGIIVRNSILLVDFIRQEVEQQGADLQEAVIRAGAVRARPIALTALAAMAGASFILDDPIFSGLAVSLIFGILVSTLLTLVVIPVVYYAYNWRRHQARAA